MLRIIVTAAAVLLLVGAVFTLFVLPAPRVVDAVLTSESPLLPSKQAEGVFPAGSDGYLIIAPDALLKHEALRRFAGHKHSLGFSVSTASVEDINKAYASGELADRIRQYLKDNAGKLDLRYVLLIGNPDPADVRVKLPVDEDLPFYVVSVPSRSLGGTYVWDEPDGEIGADGQHRLVVLTGPNLQVLRPGEIRYWYVNCTKPGRIRLVISRKDGDVFKHTARGSMEEVTTPGVAVRATEPIQVEAGDFVGFELPSEGAATIATVNAHGTTCAQILELRDGEYAVRSMVHTDALPLFQCSVYFEPEDGVGSVPSKMCWPMGTYNGVYGALLRESCLSQCPTDAYFANLSGNWDANSNGFYGETFLKFFRYDGGAPKGELAAGDFKSARGAFLPELLVGRIPFDDPETVSAILEKTIRYETEKDKSWRKHCLLAADPLAPDTDNYALCELLKRDVCEPAGFKVTRFYTEHDFEGEVQSPRKYEYKPEAFVSLEDQAADRMAGYERFSELWAERRPGLVLWSSHANTDICRNIITLRDESADTHPMPVTRQYVEALDDSYPAVVFAAACSLTQPEDYYLGTRKKHTRLEHDWEPRPNLGKELLKNGAIAVVGPTRSTWFQHGWDSPEDGGCLSLAYDFASRFLGGESAAYSLAAALRDYNTRWGSELTDGENLIGFVVYGDPSLKLGLEKKQTRPLVKPPAPVVKVSTPVSPDEAIVVSVEGEDGTELETGTVSEIPNNEFKAGADRAGEWFEARGFTLSDKRTPSGRFSYYSGTARHGPSTLTLHFPLMPGQRLNASYHCWFRTEPGLDYAVFEKSPDGRRWEPLAVYSGVSTGDPLFGQHHAHWKMESIDFSVGDRPAYLRFRYVANDQYRKVPREGFYVDDFNLSSKSGRVRYISGWQRLSPGEEPGTYAFRQSNADRFYLRISPAGRLSGLNESRDIYRLAVSEPRALSWAETLRRPRGLAGIALAVFGLLLAAASALLWSRAQSKAASAQ
jgi:hypothetical protein